MRFKHLPIFLRVLWVIELLIVIAFAITFFKNTNLLVFGIIVILFVAGAKQREHRYRKWLIGAGSVIVLLLMLSTVFFIPAVILFLINLYLTWQYASKNNFTHFN